MLRKKRSVSLKLLFNETNNASHKQISKKYILTARIVISLHIRIDHHCQRPKNIIRVQKSLS